MNVPRQPIDTILGPILPHDIVAGNTTAHARAAAHRKRSGRCGGTANAGGASSEGECDARARAGSDGQGDAEDGVVSVDDNGHDGGDGASSSGTAEPWASTPQHLCHADQCALVRAGDETRCYAQGEVVAVDESFVHESINACEGTRDLLEVVILHPDLDAAASEDAQGDVERIKNLVALGAM